MTNLQDLSDMSEVSVNLGGTDDECSYQSNSKEDSSDSDEEDSGAEEYALDSQGRLSLFRKMKARMKLSDLFDDDDLRAVDSEMERIVEREKHSLHAKMEERLRILTRFDKHLDMGTHHKPLNNYFVNKQMEMQSLAQDADEDF